MNSITYGRTAYTDCSEFKALQKKKTANALGCNKKTDVCKGIQCPHKDPHKWQPDCKQHICQRDQHAQIVDCIILD